MKFVNRKVLVLELDYKKSTYLVDPASSHMLISKIKPCMSKFTDYSILKPRMAHYNSYDLREIIFLLQDNCGNSRANTYKNAVTNEAADLLVSKPTCCNWQ